MTDRGSTHIDPENRTKPYAKPTASSSDSQDEKGATTGKSRENQVQEKASEAADKAQQTVSEATETVKEKAADVSQDVKRRAAETADEVRGRAESEIDQRTTATGDRLGSVADALRDTSRDLEQRDDEFFAGYADMAADQVDQLSSYLQEHSAGDFISDLRRIAERQPEATAAVALGVGFMIGRFLKSSSTRREEHMSPSARRYYSSNYGYRQEYRPDMSRVQRIQAETERAPTDYRSTQRGRTHSPSETGVK